MSASDRLCEENGHLESEYASSVGGPRRVHRMVMAALYTLVTQSSIQDMNKDQTAFDLLHIYIYIEISNTEVNKNDFFR